jgi:hypothetical protein
MLEFEPIALSRTPPVELVDALDEFSPPLCYFGSHESDGSDYGFWLSQDALEEAQSDEDVLKVSAGDEWSDDWANYEYVLEVTDHGNCTLYNAKTRNEIWSLV